MMQPLPEPRIARAGIRSLDCGHVAEQDAAPIARESVVRRDADRRALDRRGSDASSPASLLAALPDDVSLGEQSQSV